MGSPSPSLVARSCRTLLCLMLLAVPSPAVATEGDAPPDTPVVAEARRLMDENRESMFRPGPSLVLNRDALVEIADSLAAAGEDSLAARCLGMAGWSSFRLGQMEAALEILERGIEIARRAGVRSEEYRAANAMAVSLTASGRAEEGIDLWFDLLAKNRSLGELDATARNWVNIVQAYCHLGRVPEALEASDSAQTVLATANVPDGMLGVAMGRGTLLLQAGRPLEAAAWADTALVHARRLGVRPAEGRALGLRASAAERAGRSEDALADHLAARQLLEADRFYVVNTYFARASILLRNGQLDACRAELVAVEPIVRAIGNPLYESTRLAMQGSVLLAEGDAAAAETILRGAVGTLESGREDDLRAPRPPELPRLRGTEAYTALALSQVELGQPAKAFVSLERGRTLELRRQIQGAPLPDEVPLERVQAILASAHAAIVSWTASRWSQDALFLVTADTVFAARLDAEIRESDVQVALDLLASGDDAADREFLEKLANALLRPMVEYVPENTDRLYFVPSAALAGFPLEVLPTATGGEPVGSRFATAYLASASLLPLLAERSAPARGMLVMADPEPGDAPDLPPSLGSETYRALRRTRLPAARREARRVSIPPATILLGPNATKEKLRSEADSVIAVAHFATHALSLPLRPGDSSILLAGTDDRLTADEVEQLGLHLDLVTLSGCRTGSGLHHLGEGTFGLPRSFLIGGARSVVMSLWDVEDGRAAEFMTAFYRALRRGSPRDRALQTARQEMARRGYPLRDQAAFVLTGVAHEPVAALSAYPPRPDRPGWFLPLLLALLTLALVAAAVTAARRGRSPATPNE